MKKLALILVSTIFLGGCNLKDFFVKPPAGLEISTVPTATVFLNGENLGSTPYADTNLKPGTYTLKLVPADGSALAPYETQMDLVSRTSTIINRTFASSDLDSAGYTLQLLETSPDQTYLSLISDPDLINVTLDNVPSGFTPLSKLVTTPGVHSLSVSSPGYLPQELSVTTRKGYNLLVNFKLAGETIILTPAQPSTSSATPPLSSPSPVAQATDLPKPYVVIGETETGWLRVRREPSGTAEELGKANTGEKLKYLGESTDLGWHKIEFEGSVGYVSGKYVTLVK